MPDVARTIAHTSRKVISASRLGNIVDVNIVEDLRKAWFTYREAQEHNVSDHQVGPHAIRDQ
jgi:hypothetical protein